MCVYCVSVCTGLAYPRISDVGMKEVRIFWGKFGCIHMKKCCHCLLFFLFCINHFDRNVFMYSLSLYSYIYIQIFSYSVTSAGWFFTHIVDLHLLWIFWYKCKHKCVFYALYIVWISLCRFLFCSQWFLECRHIDILMLKANLGYEWPLCGMWAYWLESHALNMSVKWLVTFIQEGSLYRLKWKYHHHHIFSALENLSSFSTKYSLSCSTDKFRNLWQLFLSTSSIKPRCIILMADFVLFTICFAFVQRLY